MFRYRQGVAPSQHMLSYWQPGALSSRYSKQHGCVTCVFLPLTMHFHFSPSLSLRSSSSYKPLPLVSLLVSLTLMMTQSWHSYASSTPALPHLRLMTMLTSGKTSLSSSKGGEELVMIPTSGHIIMTARNKLL